MRERPVLSRAMVTASLVAAAACGVADDGAEGTAGRSAAESATLGPHDGRDLPPADLDRVVVGDTAPDFTLESYRGERVTLSDFRGARDVVLVFYRGHW